MTNEAYNTMAPRPGGDGMAKTMRLALADAGIGPEEVDFINAHGSATPLNDKCETLAVKQVFGGGAAGSHVVGEVDDRAYGRGVRRVGGGRHRHEY